MVQCLLMYVTEVGRENREIKWKSQKRKRFDRSSRVSRIFWIVGLLISWFDVTLDGCRSQGSPKPKVVFGVNTKNVVGIFLLIGRKIWLAMPPTPSKPPKHPLACFCKDFWKGWTKTISWVVLKRWKKCHACLSGILIVLIISKIAMMMFLRWNFFPGWPVGVELLVGLGSNEMVGAVVQVYCSNPQWELRFCRPCWD